MRSVNFSGLSLVTQVGIGLGIAPVIDVQPEPQASILEAFGAREGRCCGFKISGPEGHEGSSPSGATKAVFAADSSDADPPPEGPADPHPIPRLAHSATEELAGQRQGPGLLHRRSR